MAGRAEAVADAIAAFLRAAPPHATARLSIDAQKLPSVAAEDPTPRLLVIPYGDDRSRTGRSVLLRSPVVSLWFTGPIAAFGDSWGAIVDAYVDALDCRPMAGFQWSGVSVEALYDPDRLEAVDRFGALYRVTYAQSVVVV